MTANILIIDDSEPVRKLLKRYLTQSGLSTLMTDNGSEGLLLVREARPDLILLDAAMPGLDGHAVCRVVRKETATRHIPIILMSGSKIAEKDVLSGLDGGADDYLTKPFSMPMLLGRIRAVLRRYDPASKVEAKLKKFGLELDPEARTANVDGQPVSLTRKEFDLLAALAGRAGRVLSVPYLLETVWGYDPADYNDPSTVEVHMSRLRRKLGPELGRRLVKMIGLGYKLQA